MRSPEGGAGLVPARNHLFCDKLGPGAQGCHCLLVVWPPVSKLLGNHPSYPRRKLVLPPVRSAQVVSRLFPLLVQSHRPFSLELLVELDDPLVTNPIHPAQLVFNKFVQRDQEDVSLILHLADAYCDRLPGNPVPHCFISLFAVTHLANDEPDPFNSSSNQYLSIQHQPGALMARSV